MLVLILVSILPLAFVLIFAPTLNFVLDIPIDARIDSRIKHINTCIDTCVDDHVNTHIDASKLWDSTADEDENSGDLIGSDKNAARKIRDRAKEAADKQTRGAMKVAEKTKDSGKNTFKPDFSASTKSSS